MFYYLRFSEQSESDLTSITQERLPYSFHVQPVSVKAGHGFWNGLPPYLPYEWLTGDLFILYGLVDLKAPL